MPVAIIWNCDQPMRPRLTASLPVLGLGFGLIFAPAINTATLGVARSDAGIASAMVNTMQQVGGSIGTALLSTIAASTTASYATSHHVAATASKRLRRRCNPAGPENVRSSA